MDWARSATVPGASSRGQTAITKTLIRRRPDDSRAPRAASSGSNEPDPHAASPESHAAEPVRVLADEPLQPFVRVLLVDVRPDPVEADHLVTVDAEVVLDVVRHVVLLGALRRAPSTHGDRYLVRMLEVVLDVRGQLGPHRRDVVAMDDVPEVREIERDRVRAPREEDHRLAEPVRVACL